MPEVEIPQSANSQHEKRVGILIAVIAVIMAIVSAFGTDAANNMIVSEVKSSNGFAWYQAKRQRSYLNELEIGRIDIELLGNPTDAQKAAMEKLKAKLKAKNAEYEEENKKILTEAKEFGAEAKTASAKNDAFDRSEILLQVAVVLCSLTLLTGLTIFIRFGVVVAIVGVIFCAIAFRAKADPEPETAPAPAKPAVTAPAVTNTAK